MDGKGELVVPFDPESCARVIFIFEASESGLDDFATGESVVFCHFEEKRGVGGGPADEPLDCGFFIKSS